MSEDILHKVPNPPFEVEIMDKAPAEVMNPFSKQKVMLEPIAVAVYDCIKAPEMLEDYDVMQKRSDWFIESCPTDEGVALD